MTGEPQLGKRIGKNADRDTGKRQTEICGRKISGTELRKTGGAGEEKARNRNRNYRKSWTGRMLAGCKAVREKTGKSGTETGEEKSGNRNREKPERASRRPEILRKDVKGKFREKPKEKMGLISLSMRFFPVFDFLQTRFDFALHPLFGGEIVFFPEQGIGQALHGGELVLRIVGILVALAVVQFFHESGGCIAYDERNGFGASFLARSYAI